MFSNQNKNEKWPKRTEKNSKTGAKAETETKRDHMWELRTLLFGRLFICYNIASWCHICKEDAFEGWPVELSMYVCAHEKPAKCLLPKPNSMAKYEKHPKQDKRCKNEATENNQKEKKKVQNNSQRMQNNKKRCTSKY